MTAQLRWWDGGTWRTATKIRRLVSTGPDVWTEVVRIRRWSTVGSTQSWQDVYIKGGTTPPPSPPPTPTPTPAPSVTLAVAVTPATISGTKPSAGTVITNTATAAASKGTGPYTYKWTLGTWPSGYTPGITNPNSAATTFSLNLAAGKTVAGKMRCKATDANGNTGTVLIDATFYTGTTSNTSVDWADITASGSATAVSGTNADRTMPAAGTLNFTNDAFPATMTVYKNGSAAGTGLSSLAVNANDLIHFKFTANPDDAEGDCTVTGSGGLAGLVSDTFHVSLSHYGNPV